jgi:hypothetical protein
MVYLRRFAYSVGDEPDSWDIEPGDRPDFSVNIPRAGRVGVEVTEVLDEAHGRARALDVAVTAVHCHVVEEYLARYGGVGAALNGSTQRLPANLALLSPVEAAWRAHLERFGGDLRSDRGEMMHRFDHEYGYVEHVQRLDSWGRCIPIEAHQRAPLPHKTDLPQDVLERMIVERAQVKAKQATGYAHCPNLWLVVRNPYQWLTVVSGTCRRLVADAAGARFDRVVLFNDSEDLYFRYPPPPWHIDLLARH